MVIYGGYKSSTHISLHECGYILVRILIVNQKIPLKVLKYDYNHFVLTNYKIL